MDSIGIYKETVLQYCFYKLNIFLQPRHIGYLNRSFIHKFMNGTATFHFLKQFSVLRYQTCKNFDELMRAFKTCIYGKSVCSFFWNITLLLDFTFVTKMVMFLARIVWEVINKSFVYNFFQNISESVTELSTIRSSYIRILYEQYTFVHLLIKIVVILCNKNG